MDIHFQLDEVLTLQIHTRTKYQELFNKSVELESKIMFLDQQYSETTFDIDNLNEEISLEKLSISATGVKLMQTKNSLRKSNVMLHASQKGEARLTLETKRLLKTLSDSHSDSEKLFQQLHNLKETNYEKEKVTIYMHSSVCMGLERILFYLKNYYSFKSDYHESMILCKKNSYHQGYNYLESILELMKEMSLFVYKLKSTILSQILSQNGILLDISSLSIRMLDSIDSNRFIFDEGEKCSLYSLKKVFFKLEDNLEKVQYIEHVYKLKSDRILESLFENIFESKKKVVTLIESSQSSLSNIRKSNLKTISDLSIIISQWHNSLITSVSCIKIDTKNQRLLSDNFIETLAEDILHQDILGNALSEYSSNVKEMIVDHLLNISSQMYLISIQGRHFFESQQKQCGLQEKFVQNVMNGLYKLIISQMKIIQRDQEEHSSLFEKRKRSIIIGNTHLNNATNFILDKIKERLNLLTKNIQHHYRNKHSIKLKDFIIEIKEVFFNLGQMSIAHIAHTHQHKRMIEMNREDLAHQSYLLYIAEKYINKWEDDFLIYLSRSLLDYIYNGISEITKDGVYLCKIASEKMINKVTLTLKKLEELHISLISNLSTRFQILSDIMCERIAEIDTIARESFITIDNSCKNSINIGHIFFDSEAKKRNLEKYEKDTLVSACTKRNVKLETSILSASLDETTLCRRKINGFVTNVLNKKKKP